MIAKAAWKPTKTIAGTVPTSAPSTFASPKNWVGSPSSPPIELPNAIEKP